MKWIALLPIIAFLTGCGCCGNRSIVEYQQVAYTPAVVTTPVYYDPVVILGQDPIDVTTTVVGYY